MRYLGFLLPSFKSVRLVGVAVAVCVLAACSDGDSSNDAPSDGNNPSPIATVERIDFNFEAPQVSAANNASVAVAEINVSHMRVNEQPASEQQFQDTQFTLSGDHADLFSLDKNAQTLSVVFNKNSNALIKDTCANQVCAATLRASLNDKAATLALQVTLTYPQAPATPAINRIDFNASAIDTRAANQTTVELARLSAQELRVNGQPATAEHFNDTVFSLAGANANVFDLSKAGSDVVVRFNAGAANLVPNTCADNVCVATVVATLNGKRAELSARVQLTYTFEFAQGSINQSLVGQDGTVVLADIASLLRYNNTALSAQQRQGLTLSVTGTDAARFAARNNKLVYKGGLCDQPSCRVGVKAVLTVNNNAQEAALDLVLLREVGSGNSTSLTLDANVRQYVNLDNNEVKSSEFYGWDLYIEREAIVLRENTKSAYLNTTDFAAASTSGANFASTHSYGNGKSEGDVRGYKPSLYEWNDNWFGKSVFNAGIDGERMNWQTQPFGGLYSPNYAIRDANGNNMLNNNLDGGADKLSHGLFYPRRENVNGIYNAGNDKKDFMAIPQNQLIVRTSKGTKFVRLRAIQGFDYNDANAANFSNLRSNNIYFKYAVQDLAAGDTSFGAERDMCISFTTGAKEPKYKQYDTIVKNSQWSQGVGIFKYGFMHSDGFYKQAFIDFDKIIQGPGNSVVDFKGNTTNLTGNSYAVRGKDGSTNTYPEVANYNTTAATRMYSEGCMPAFWGDRQASRYPVEYLNGFGVKGADTPLHNRRADWLIDNPDATQTSYNGQDEWDIAMGVLVRPKNIWDFGRQSGIVYAPIIANSGRTGDNTNGELRNKGGLAAMVMVTGTGLDGYSPSDALNTHTNASESGNFVPVQSINDPRVEGKWQATGRSMVERYNHIKVDNSSGTPVITTNGRVYAIQTANGTVRKLQVSGLTFDSNTATYELTYE